MKEIALIGYSGHAFVVYDIFNSRDQIVGAYADKTEKSLNPFGLIWLGDENEVAVIEKIKTYAYFVCVGDNLLREKISQKLLNQIGIPLNALHKTAIIGQNVTMGYGNMFAAGVIINPVTQIGNNIICNTGCVIEHECNLHNNVHISPGVVLCGNVEVGQNSFVGANSVVKQGIKIGKNVIIGAGSVIIHNVPDNSIVYGNPGKIIK